MRRPTHGAPGARTAFRLHLEYEGTRYSGWQRQGEKQSAQGVRTVSGSIERVLAEAGLRPLAFMGSGRTDAGVHALEQVAHLHLPAGDSPALRDLRRILDDGLPHDIVVRDLRPCAPTFHARHDAQSRTYLYALSIRRTAFAKPFVWWVRRPLDGRVLQEALGAFVGSHDVTSFADLDPGDDPRLHIQASSAERVGALWVIRVQATHFLRRQVRRMVGAAVACALGDQRVEQIRADLASRSREAALRWSERAAPSSGLFLAQVTYPGEPAREPQLGFAVP